jgi:hypothetical protein
MYKVASIGIAIGALPIPRALRARVPSARRGPECRISRCGRLLESLNVASKTCCAPRLAESQTRRNHNRAEITRFFFGQALRSGGVLIEHLAGKNSIRCITLPTKTVSLRTQ